MAIGISGDVQAELGAQNPLPATTLTVIELRTLSVLIQGLLASNELADEIDTIRADQAFALSVQTPLPGTGR